LAIIVWSARIPKLLPTLSFLKVLIRLRTL
jgi:hypothetical protein